MPPKAAKRTPKPASPIHLSLGQGRRVNLDLCIYPDRGDVGFALHDYALDDDLVSGEGNRADIVITQGASATRCDLTFGNTRLNIRYASALQLAAALGLTIQPLIKAA